MKKKLPILVCIVLITLLAVACAQQVAPTTTAPTTTAATTTAPTTTKTTAATTTAPTTTKTTAATTTAPTTTKTTAATTTAPTTTAAAKPITWHFAHYYGPTAAAGRIATAVGDAMEKAFPGRFKMEYHWNGALLGEREMPDGLKAGLADWGNIVTGSQEAKFPLVSVLNLPMICPLENINMLYTQAWQFAYNIFQTPAIQQEIKQWNLVPELAMPTIMNPVDIASRYPIPTLAYLKGVKIRVPASGAALMEKLGAIPVTLLYGEVYSGLKSGLIDAAINYNYLTPTDKYYEGVDNLTLGFNYSQLQGTMDVVNQNSWNALPDDMKVVFKDALFKAVKDVLAYQMQQEIDGVKYCKEHFKNVSYLSAAEYAKFEEVAKTTWADWAKLRDSQGYAGSQVLNQALAEREKILGKK